MTDIVSREVGLASHYEKIVCAPELKHLPRKLIHSCKDDL
jgi:hypothetical protein